ncbi:site-specific integrase [Thiomonas sp.]|uniref:tyrosine-type recombinase/integrase n=1 Tax=Thiomonas sp. TaxID=2047785 RepID=UPI00258A1D44|nr:site-specific integrase [Thiomonas sp.]
MAQIRRRGMPTLSRTFDLKSEAQAWASEIERELRRGNAAVLRNDAGKTTLKEVAARYIAGPVQSMRSRSDVMRYMRAASDRFGPMFLSAIRAVDVTSWRDQLLADGLAPQSAIHHLNALSGLFSFVEKELSIALPSGNPVRGIRKPSLPKSRERRLRAGELDALLSAGDAGRSDRIPGMRQAITLAVETSMRLGEMLGLEWSRIDLTQRTAHLVDTKNGESRTVALSSAALDALQSLPRRTDGRVFAWRSSQSFERSWRLCKARALATYATVCFQTSKTRDPAFLSDLRFHDLRHEATSRLFEKGLGVMEVASMTGHKSLSMLKRYTHVEAEKLAQKLG